MIKFRDMMAGRQTISGDFAVVWNELAGGPVWVIKSHNHESFDVPYAIKPRDFLLLAHEKKKVFEDCVIPKDLPPISQGTSILEALNAPTATPKSWFGGNRRAVVAIMPPTRDTVGTNQQRTESRPRELLPA